MIQETEIPQPEETFYRYRYQLPTGNWQGWATVESFGEAHEMAMYHAKGRPFEIQEQPDACPIYTPDFDLNEKLAEHGIDVATLARRMNIQHSVFTQAVKRGRFSAPFEAAIRFYFLYIEARKSGGRE